MPDTNSIKEIEIEFENTLEWNEDILKATVREFKCGNDNGKTFFVGCIETIEEFIRIEVVKLEFYDTNL